MQQDATTYCLTLFLTEAMRVRVGRLGMVGFPAGWWVYTGSARRNMDARVARHLRRDKPRRWHLDYLTGDRRVIVVSVTRHAEPECRRNRRNGGIVVVSGFGASDCVAGCGSHLRWLGAAPVPDAASGGADSLRQHPQSPERGHPCT
ncbi:MULTISPECIES: GIY-YIG nuclease family protein [unclassified Halorhodospira]|uniref:GIY-YIG nuclease family protein n=1 Tax=unclassified Halorhodospira TaxID=2626748 RepID=UPI001EE9969A|nr:GIY-YIG nuclease family protein [Halorhodospira sp. M38]